MDVDIYARGVIHCSVCVPSNYTREQITRAVNLLNPTGIKSQWKVSDDLHFAGGEPNPHQCERGTRMHYLMVC